MYIHPVLWLPVSGSMATFLTPEVEYGNSD